MSFQDYSESFRAKLHLGNTNPKIVIGIAAIAIVALIVGLHVAFTGASAYSDDSSGLERVDEVDAPIVQDEFQDDETESANEALIYVHVAGCVKEPGVYSLSSSARVDDAVKAAGGLKKAADGEAVNLAEPLSDGQQIIIPEKGNEAIQAAEGVARASQRALSSFGSSTDSSKGPAVDGLVNINTASSEELRTLSGIGEAKAQKIIDYREQNGPFSSVDDLTNVSGIGEKTLESIRSSICI